MGKLMKAVLVGDNTLAEWHPLKGPDKEISEILSDFEVFQTEDYNQFSEENLKSYNLCIAFTDRWTHKLSDEQTTGLLSYVAHGGGLLIVHNGIAIQTRYELAQLAGGKFTKHPDQKVLTYTPVSSGHAIMEGIESFSVKEEPYQFALDNLIETTMLLEYESEGKQWPAAWAHGYGSGRVVYLSLGHNIETFMEPMFRKLLHASALWAVKHDSFSAAE